MAHPSSDTVQGPAASTEAAPAAAAIAIGGNVDIQVDAPPFDLHVSANDEASVGNPISDYEYHDEPIEHMELIDDEPAQQAAAQPRSTTGQKPHDTSQYDERFVRSGKRRTFKTRSFLLILRTWRQKCKIPSMQMDLLLKMLRNNSTYFEFGKLPKTWRTVVRISKKNEMKTTYKIEEWGTPKNRQRYVYIGIERRLQQYMPLYIDNKTRGEF
jgi:hypothetical protein